MSEKMKLEENLFSNLFEIELKEHYEDVFFFRDEEIELVNDIKMFSKQRRAGSQATYRNSNYLISVAPSRRSARTPGRFDG